MGRAVLPTILLVDSDVVRARATATDLKRSLAGYDIQTTSQGGDLLERISNLPEGTCVCIVLPDSTGESKGDLVTRIRWRGADVPVVCAPDGRQPSARRLADRILRAVGDARRSEYTHKPNGPSSKDATPQSSLGPDRLSALPHNSVKQRSRSREGHDEVMSLHAAMEMAQAICRKDQATSSHCMWVGWLAAEVGRRMGMDPARAEELRTAGVLHDVGKLSIPESVLQKPGPLTRQERRLVDRHAEVGAKLVARHHGSTRVQQAIRCHHDWYDGSRNVSGQNPNTLSEFARILSATDAFLSMIEERPYRTPRTSTQAIQELRRCSGTQFDPEVVEVLATMIQPADAA